MWMDVSSLRDDFLRVNGRLTCTSSTRITRQLNAGTDSQKCFSADYLIANCIASAEELHP